MKKKKKSCKAIILLAVILTLLTGCNGGPAQPAVQEVLLLQPEARAEPTRLVFAIDPSFEPVFSVAAEDFAGRVSALSHGELMVTVEKRPDAAAALATGQAQFAFVDSRVDRDWCKHFPAVSMPFLYTDYKSFTMAVNSAPVLSMLAEDTLSRWGVRPLAGLYRPGRQFVTVRQSDNYGMFDAAAIALDPDSRAVAGLRALGANTVTPENQAQLAEWFGQGDIEGAEMTLAEIAAMQWPEGERFITMSYHDLSPMWLFAPDDMLRELTPWQRAAVTEAAAYLFHTVDGSFLTQEQSHKTALEKREFLFSDEFHSVRAEILSVMQDMPDSPIGQAERYMLDILRS